MGQYLNPRYGQVVLVSGYPVLTSIVAAFTHYNF